MIIGKGDIASVLKKVDRDGFIFFASGVSNSQEKDSDKFQREVDLLMDQDRTAHLVYFSSLSVFYKKSPYTEHKKKMEALVKLEFPNYTIVRLGNITWGKNPNTLINYFRNRIETRQSLIMRDELRYVVHLMEFLHWMSLIPEWSCEMNVPGKVMTVEEIVAEYGYIGQDLR